MKTPAMTRWEEQRDAKAAAKREGAPVDQTDTSAEKARVDGVLAQLRKRLARLEEDDRDLKRQLKRARSRHARLETRVTKLEKFEDLRR